MEMLKRLSIWSRVPAPSLQQPNLLSVPLVDSMGMARIAVDIKLSTIAIEDEGWPKTNADLAASTGASLALVKSVARSCVTVHMLDEQGPGIYFPDNLTGSSRNPSMLPTSSPAIYSLLPNEYSELTKSLKLRLLQLVLLEDATVSMEH
ncbi:hypothetical protein F5Y15DRAFT_413226 [Xylariaceae sp. FL0016]|nr:hypothetical protein F5Y15DRAFT_413226 [Xylariaceae sp. FL0016]